MASGAVGDFVACALLVVDQVVGFFVTEVFGFLYVAGVYFVQVDAEGWGAADGHYGHAGLGGAVGAVNFDAGVGELSGAVGEAGGGGLALFVAVGFVDVGFGWGWGCAGGG